ncbi:unnamed protein product [Macrosiphum euphorbiae]|uniref:Uncharacterized protein n=1 Tax=Macrosiphum euphorbiae TaxID=13131 RepID=A0AAV0VK01_9HEMI|nr:unnamed protein product [Macrosiphum euphorbiae]CAI6343702.1 unnamed protein product [Macrosiphum euphorbiae]
MYGNIIIYGGGKGGRNGKGGRGGKGGEGGDRGRGGDRRRGGASSGAPSTKKFSGKCDLCHVKGHKVLACPKLISMMAIAEAATSRPDVVDGEPVAGGGEELEAGGESVDGGETVDGGN